MLTLDCGVVFVDCRTENQWEELEEHVQERLYAGAVQVSPAETPDTRRCRLHMSFVTQLCGGWVSKVPVTPTCHLGTGCHGLSHLKVRVHSTEELGMRVS